MKNTMKVLFLTSVDHPQVRMESESLRRFCDLNYVVIKGFKKMEAFISLIKKLPILFLSLLRLRIPPVPIKLFIYCILTSSILLDEIKRNGRKYNLIYAHWLYPAGFVGLVLSRIINSKVVSVVWGYDIQAVQEVKGYGIKGLKRVLSKYVIMRSDLTVLNHTAHQRIVAALLGNVYNNLSHKVIHFPLGIPDIAKNAPENLTEELKVKLSCVIDKKIMKGKKIILYSPSLRPYYGVIEFIKAIPLVNSNIDNCLFIIVGEGELRGVAERLIQDDEILKNRVFFTGRISHRSVTVLYRLSSVVCDLAYPGPGTTTLEAFCFGKAVIGIKAPKKIIEHGVNGFIVKKGDYKELANYIITILKNPDLERMFSLNARKTFEKEFSIDKRIKTLLEVFNKLITSSDGERRGYFRTSQRNYEMEN